MFETNNEAFKFLNKLGYFICRYERGSMKLPMVCKKISSEEFIEIQGVDSFTDKIAMNTIIFDKNSPILNTIELSVFSEYDKIELENKNAKELQKQIKKDSKSIMNVQNGILARGYGSDYYVVDIDKVEALPIDKSLIETADVKYRKDIVINALKNTGVNRLKPKYERQEKIFKAIGK